MPQCPQCGKPLAELSRQCPSCKADLDLLVDYVNHLQNGLEVADGLTRAGDLDRAVWAYLSVLEVDPDNPVARRQVSRVATAVRQFDRTSPGRRWLAKVRGEPEAEDGQQRGRWLRRGLVLVLLVIAFLLGYSFGAGPGETSSGDGPPPPPKAAPLGGP